VHYHRLSLEGVALEEPGDRFADPSSGAPVVDELRLVVAPAVVGPGRRVLHGGDAVQALELIGVQ
jgi:hypothetical protein